MITTPRKPEPEKPVYCNNGFQWLPSDDVFSSEWTLDEASSAYRNNNNWNNRPFKSKKP